MKITTIATGSSANCYILESEKGAIIIEAGVPLIRVFKYKPIGIIYTHEHLDHSRYVNEYRGYHLVKDPPCIIGDEFEIKTFPVQHSIENKGFVIKSISENKRLFFATDFNYIENLPSCEFDAIMIECSMMSFHKNFLTIEQQMQVNAHADSDITLHTLRRLIFTKECPIILIHRSIRFGHSEKMLEFFKKKMQRENIYGAAPNVSIEF